MSLKYSVLCMFVFFLCFSCAKEDIKNETNNETNIVNNQIVIESFSPAELKPGFKMTILGGGFSDQIDEIRVEFTSRYGGIVLGKVLNAANNQIDVAIPPYAITGDFKLKVGTREAVSSINLNPIVHKFIYSNFNTYSNTGDYGLHGYYRHVTQSYPNNELQVTLSRNGTGHESGILAYDPSNRVFYGFNKFGTSDSFIYFSKIGSSIYDYWNTTANSPSSYTNGCDGFVNVLTNTNNFKKYVFSLDRDLNTLITYFNLHEINFYGAEIANHSFTLSTNAFYSFHSNLVFIPSSNKFIFISEENNSTKIRLNMIDANDFSYSTYLFSQSFIAPINPNSYYKQLNICFNPNNGKIYLGRYEDIYEIDPDLVTIFKLNSDWKEFIDSTNTTGLSEYQLQPQAIIYYEPTNDLYISNDAAKIYALNLTSKEVRIIQNGSRIIGNKVVIKD